MSTSLLPPAASGRACEALAAEFRAQAALERAAGLPVSVAVTPLADVAALARSELGFIDLAVSPLFARLAAVLPDLGALGELIDTNRQRWLAIAAGRVE